MSDWTSGYVADVGYTFGYYNELNPLSAQLAFTHSSLAFPEIRHACELGFGQGVSVNLHAAGSDTQWHGTDFNPSQAAFAKKLAGISGAQVQLNEEAFAEFAQRTDLPNFDYIGLHGIWSWISDDNRAVIVDFIRRKLNVGGVLYVSYNTLPGWAASVPLRHLLTEHAEVMAAPGRGTVPRINAALEFAEKLFTLNPKYVQANPGVQERLQAMKQQNRHYLAHEYFNRDWHPMHFATMAQWLEPAKLSYACSANYLDHVHQINLSPDQQAFLQDIPDPHFRESVRDFLTNQQFRKDYWVKGPNRLTPAEQLDSLRQQRVVLVTSRSEVRLKVRGHLGEAVMSDAIYGPILDRLASHQPMHIGTLESELKDKLNLGQIMEAIMILIGAGHVLAAQDDTQTTHAHTAAQRLNAHLIHKSRSSQDVQYLCSPVTGGGFQVGRFEQFFLLGLQEGLTKASQLGEFAWRILAEAGHKIQKEGVVLDTAEAHIQELSAQAKHFLKHRWPILQALQIAWSNNLVN